MGKGNIIRSYTNTGVQVCKKKNKTLQMGECKDVWRLEETKSFQSLGRVRIFVTLWSAERQASLSITNSSGLLKLMSIESVMPSNHLILCHPLLLLPSIFLSIRVFSNESDFRIRSQSIGASASISVLPKVFSTDFL